MGQPPTDPYRQAFLRLRSYGGRQQLGLFRGLLDVWLSRSTRRQRTFYLAVLGFLLLCVVGTRLPDLVEAVRQQAYGQAATELYWLAVGGAALSFPIRYVLAAQRFQDFQLTTTEPAARLGGEVKVIVRLTPHRSFELERLVVKLVGNESAQYTDTERMGKDRRTYVHSHDQVQDEQVVQEKQPLHAGVPHQLSARLRVPRNAMHTFHEGSCAYEWRVEMLACSPSFPDLRKELSIEVLPELVSDAHG